MKAPLTTASLLENVQEIAPIIQEHAVRGEQERRLAPSVVEAMVEAGLFRMWTPQVFGGLEVDPVTAMRVFEEVSRLDSAAGWNLQLASAVVPFFAWFPDAGVEEIFRGNPDVIFSGTLFPPGHAVPVEGGVSSDGTLALCQRLPEQCLVFWAGVHYGWRCTARGGAWRTDPDRRGLPGQGSGNPRHLAHRGDAGDGQS